MNLDTVTISAKEYKELKMAQKKLDALEAGGVNNWEWYSQSLEDAGYNEDEGDQDEL